MIKYSEEVEKLKQKLDSFYDEKNAINNKIVYFQQELKVQCELEKEEYKKNNTLTLEELITEYDEVGESFYKEFQEYIKKYYDIGLYHLGSFSSDTNQRILALKINKDYSDQILIYLNNLLIETIIPVLKPSYEDECGNKYIEFEIFERTCAQYGGYRLSIKDNVYYLCKSTRRVESYIKKSDSLLEVLKYIRQHHYYE